MREGSCEEVLPGDPGALFKNPLQDCHKNMAKLLIYMKSRSINFKVVISSEIIEIRYRKAPFGGGETRWFLFMQS